MNAVSHYDQGYYQTHYARVWNDAQYYDCQARHWRRTIFDRNGINIDQRVLDYGSGLGQVSAALPNRACFDVSAEARQFMRGKGTLVFDRPEDIPNGAFDAVLCSHSLEHHAEPLKSLESFRRFVKPGGMLILALPEEVRLAPSLQADWDRHFYAWTFQTITNLLVHAGWAPLHQSKVYGSFILRTLGVRLGLPIEQAVRISETLGRLRGIYPTMLTVARLATPER